MCLSKELKKTKRFLCFRDKIVSKEFMRKYIHIAKAVTPVLTEEAANHIAEEYSRLRSQEQMGADIARVGRTHTHTSLTPSALFYSADILTSHPRYRPSVTISFL